MWRSYKQVWGRDIDEMRLLRGQIEIVFERGVAAFMDSQVKNSLDRKRGGTGIGSDIRTLGTRYTAHYIGHMEHRSLTSQH